MRRKSPLMLLNAYIAARANRKDLRRRACFIAVCRLGHTTHVGLLSRVLRADSPRARRRANVFKEIFMKDSEIFGR
jgi:hypothetical protein